MPELGEMIKCEDWYHMDLCVNVPIVMCDNKFAHWYCNSCNPYFFVLVIFEQFLWTLFSL